MAVDPILEVDEKVVGSVVEGKDVKNEEPATPEKKKEEGEEGGGEVPASPDPYYPPIIYLPEVVVNSGEEDEEEAFKRRAKLYRFVHLIIHLVESRLILAAAVDRGQSSKIVNDIFYNLRWWWINSYRKV